MTHYLDFEKPLAEIEGKAEELRAMARAGEGVDVEEEAAALDRKAATMLRDLYKDLTPWRKCQVARHPERPHCRDYISALFTEYTPLAGDRNFADDHAVMGGLARFEDRPVVVDGEIVIRPMMYIALSYDHRLIDGREAVTALKIIKEAIEDPTRMLIDL